MSEVIWISHRGYCKDAVENTRKSFDAAIALGFTHLETDLRTTSDGTIILQHNASLDHTCGLPNEVEKTTWGELRSFKTTDDQVLLRLDDLYKAYSVFSWTLDIKGPADRRTLDQLLLWTQKNQAKDWLQGNVRFLLWSAASESYAKTLFPGVLTLAQEKECLQAGVSVLCRLPRLGGIKKGRTYSVPPRFGRFTLFTQRTLKAYHAQGARLLAYLPDREEDAKIAYLLGFDEILTNGRKLF